MQPVTTARPRLAAPSPIMSNDSPAAGPSMKSVSPRSNIESSPSMAEEAELPPWPKADSEDRFILGDCGCSKFFSFASKRQRKCNAFFPLKVLYGGPGRVLSKRASALRGEWCMVRLDYRQRRVIVRDCSVSICRASCRKYPSAVGRESKSEESLVLLFW